MAERIQNLDEVNSFWSDFSSSYQHGPGSFTVSLSQALASFLKLDSAKCLLEVGAGPGQASEHLIPLMNADAHYMCTDLSEEMVLLSKDRLAPLISDPKLPKVTVQTQNGQQLTFDDGKFDRYLSSLCLQITPDPDAQIAECKRVLAKDGIAAFSTWGRVEHSPFFALSNKVAAKFDTENESDAKKEEKTGSKSGEKPEKVEKKPKTRSNFHLSDLAALRNRFLSHGFRQVTAFYFPVLAPFSSGDEYSKFVLGSLPHFRKLSASISLEKLSKLQKQLSQEAQRVLDRGDPIQFEAVCLIAYL